MLLLYFSDRLLRISWALSIHFQLVMCEKVLAINLCTRECWAGLLFVGREGSGQDLSLLPRVYSQGGLHINVTQIIQKHRSFLIKLYLFGIY